MPDKKRRTSEASSSTGLAPSSSFSVPHPRPSRAPQLTSPHPLPSSVARSTSPSFSLRQMTDEEAETYRIACRNAGLWAQVEEHMAAAVEMENKEEPNVEQESPPPGAWVCRACKSWASRHKLYCTRVGCPTRRELLQKWKPGDYFCTVCGNHRFKHSVRCQWVHCHSNDWVCPTPQCRNLNYSARRYCNTMWCREPRLFSCGKD